MGRPRTYATSSAKKRAKRQRERQHPRTKVYLGKNMDLWNLTKQNDGLDVGDISLSDADFAKILLDRLVIYNLSASIIFILSHISKRITKWTMLCWKPASILLVFLQCRRCRCDGCGNRNQWRHGHGLGCGQCGMCAYPLILVPPRNALC